ETSHIAAFLDPRYKKYCFQKMISYEIQSPIKSLLEQQQQQGVHIISTKKVSSFLKKLKEATSDIINEDDKVHKYWISAKAEDDVEPLDWWKTHFIEYPNLSKLAHE
ncbi:17476_t:CDS:1, partial [Funneliformis geosporum]